MRFSDTSHLNHYIVHFKQIKNMSYRIGFGVDYHQLAEGGILMIGGVKCLIIKEQLAIVMLMFYCMLLCDALLGAACLGDIGTHFPDTDKKL